MRKNRLLSGLGRFRSGVLVLSLLIAAVGILRTIPCSAANADDITSSADRRGAVVTTSKPDDALRVRVSDIYGKLPLYFEANRGQTDPAVNFLARSIGHTLFLTPTETVLVFTKPEHAGKGEGRDPKAKLENPRKATQTVLRMTFLGANPDARATGQAELTGKANYFIGNDPTKWRTQVPMYARVRYDDLYPGIDLIYYGKQRQLEYDFVVRPGAVPSSIALRFSADKIEVDAQGDLVLHTAAGEIRQRKPVIYQMVEGARREIAGGYVVKDRDQVGFELAAYDATRPLVIDPVLFYSTYLGGGGNDQGFAIAVDAGGNAYVAGVTDSADFPTTAGAFQTTFGGGLFDAFVTKLNPTGSALVYSTYLGGSGDDFALGIAVDATGAAYVTGVTNSPNFPRTTGAFQTTYGGGVQDAFVTKLNPTGSALVYSTYLGGSAAESAFAIAVDATGSAYVTGDTLSSNFPTTAGAFKTVLTGPSDTFVTKLNPIGSALVYSTLLGGSGVDNAQGIVVDAAGNAYVTGETNSTDFPTTAGAFQTVFGGGSSDGFVTKVNPTGSGLVYSTYLGGNGRDAPTGQLAIDSLGNAYITGGTSSSNFPTTAGAFQTTFAGGAFDAFVTKLNPFGTGLVYSTLLGGSGDEFGRGIAVDSLGNAFVAGHTNSTNFPTLNPIQATFGGGTFDAFVTAVNATGSGLIYSTYLGGSAADAAQGIALDDLRNPNAYVTGFTSSLNFPTTVGAFRTTFGGGPFDAFVTKITNVVLPPSFTGRVTGGGSINVSGGIGTLGFIVQGQSTSGPISGDLQYVNHASGAKVHSVMFTSLEIVGPTATFGGTCTNNGVPCTFNVTVQDNGEPGTNDAFIITIDVGPPEGGTLRSGNILIHQ